MKWSEVKVTQLCLTLGDPMDHTVHGILQARIVERVAFPSPGDLPNPGIEPKSLALQVNSLPAESQVKPKENETKWQKKKKLPPAKRLCSIYFNGRKKNFFWWHHVAYGTLVPWPRAEPRPPTKEAKRPSPWIPRKPLIRLLWRL